MSRKKLIYLKLYVKDFTGDELLRLCSPATWGVYSFLLCILNSSTPRGMLQLSKLELRPHLKRSLTQRTLNATTDHDRLAPFAEHCQKQMPWKRNKILRGLEELFYYGIITVEDDKLIQPRMYRDGGGETQAETQVITPIQPTKPNQPITPKPEPEPKPEKPKKEKKEKPSLPFDDFWKAYDKKVDRPTCEKLWSNLKIEEQEAIMLYIPQYIEAEPDKKFRKNPTTFLRHHSWTDELIRKDRAPKRNKTILQDNNITDNTEEW